MRLCKCQHLLAAPSARILLFITVVYGLVRPSWLCSLHLQSGFSKQPDRSSEETKSEAPLELGLERCLISIQGLHTFMAHIDKNQKTDTHTHKCITAFDSNTFRALPTPTSSLALSLTPNFPHHFPFFLQCTSHGSKAVLLA